MSNYSMDTTSLRSKSKIGYASLPETKCLVLEKRDKTYSINNLNTQNYFENQTLIIEFPKTGKFIDPNKSFFKFRLKYSNCTDGKAVAEQDEAFNIGASIRTVMDLFKEVKVYHQSNTLLYSDDDLNKHWLHDVAASSSPEVFKKIQKQGFGFNVITGFQHQEIPCNILPRFNKFSKNWYRENFEYRQPVAPFAQGVADIDDPANWDEFANNQPGAVEAVILKKLQRLLIKNRRNDYKKEASVSFNVNSNSSTLRHVTYYVNYKPDGAGGFDAFEPEVDYIIPLSWIPFFKSIHNSLLPPHITDNLRIELTLEANELFMASLTDIHLDNTHKLQYTLSPGFLSLNEIRFTPAVQNIVDNQSKSTGLNWYFHNTTSKYIHSVTNEVDITLNLPLSSLVVAKAIPYHTKLLIDKTINGVNPYPDFLFQQTVGVNNIFINLQDMTVNQIKAYNAFSFNSNVSCEVIKPSPYFSDFQIMHYTDILFKKWRFQLGFQSFTTDEIDDSKTVFPINTYNEMLKAYEHKHKTSTITFEDFSLGSLYQAVCNFERDPYYQNTGYQCDRDFPLNFRASFNKTLDNVVEKSIYLFVTHIKTAIFVGDKVVIKT